MALRTKTIEYAFTQLDTNLNAATRNDFGAITLNIPETSSRTIRSAIIEITARDNVAVAASMTSWLIGIKLGAVAFSDASVVDTITNTGENVSFHFVRDVTAYFVSNFGAGASQTCQVGVQFGGVATINVSAKLIITYEYDDSAATTRIKTVRIPLDGTSGALTNVLAEIGTNQIPNLDSFLPEASKTYRDIFFEVNGNEEITVATNTSLALALDAEAEVQDGLHDGTLISACWFRRIWKRTDMTTNATHAFKARSTVTGNGFNHMQVVLVVTYEYDHSASNSIMNSVLIPLGEEAGLSGWSTVTDKSRLQRTIMIQETSPVLAQSAVLITYGATVNNTPTLAVGAQSARAYTDAAANYCGGIHLQQRIDSGGAQGASQVLTRGENTFVVDLFTIVATTWISNTTAMLILNYTSSKHSSGDGVHLHTTAWAIASTAADTSSRKTTAMAPNLPEANWWNVMTGYLFSSMVPAPDANSVVLTAEVQSGEGAGDGWRDLYSGTLKSDVELGPFLQFVLGRDEFQRNPNDPDTNRLALETSRVYRIDYAATSYSSLYMLLTYHAITYAVSGQLMGYTGDGSGVTVEFHRSDTDEKVLTLTSAAGGSYNGLWYDNTINLYAQARQDSSHVGRSDDGVAT
jgi:hypothetical protein